MAHNTTTEDPIEYTQRNVESLLTKMWKINASTMSSDSRKQLIDTVATEIDSFQSKLDDHAASPQQHRDSIQTYETGISMIETYLSAHKNDIQRQTILQGTLGLAIVVSLGYYIYTVHRAR